MFIDEITLTIKGGHGGPGKISFLPGYKSGPDGGNGGKGGDVYIQPTTDLTALKSYASKKLITADNGQPGMSNRKFGRDGQDKILILPVGSLIKDLSSDQEFEVVASDGPVLFCKGGLGGRGNYEFRSSKNTTPMYAQPGLNGQEKKVTITLKLIADFGLIGLPNAGKTSLLNALTSANAKIADYPFTTLEPNLGVMDDKIIADIPGLIEGASSGKGLGVKFLKHIEKVSTLLHCISAESADPLTDYQIVRHELKNFNANLPSKPEIIIITKSDIKGTENPQIKIGNKKTLTISIYDPGSIQKLRNLLNQRQLV